jgi:hypothetical protein
MTTVSSVLPYCRLVSRQPSLVGETQSPPSCWREASLHLCELTTIFGIHIRIIGMAATWVDRSSSRGDAAKYEDLQHFILFHIISLLL